MIITKNIKKIEEIENRIFNNEDTTDINYYDHCILSFYLYKYFENNSNQELSDKYFFRSRISLKNYFTNAKFISLSNTWYGGIGLLYIMRGLNKDGDLTEKISYMESRIGNYIINDKKNYNQNLFDSDYNILNGLAGVGIYYLDNNPDKYYQLLNVINDRLIQILSLFYTSNSETQYSLVNGKEVDYCISHGILGILFYLSKYYKLYKDEKILDQINLYLTDYISFLEDENLSCLNKFPMYAKKLDNKIGYKYPKRVSWCYGTIGIYRAMYLISKNIGNISMRKKIINQMKMFEIGDLNKYNLKCPTFCHGYSGAYYIFSVFNKDEGNLNFDILIEKLQNKIWSFYDEKFIYCFPKYDYDKYGNIHNKQTKTSIVDGIASICIAYLSSKIDIDNDFFAKSLALK